MDTKFKEGFMNICKGVCMIMISCWRVIANNKLLCSLITSVVLNILLAVSIGKARAERDNRDSVAYVMEQKVDSLELIK